MAQMDSVRLGIEGLLVRDSPESLSCFFDKTLYWPLGTS